MEKTKPKASSLDRRVVLITGCSSGFGRGLVTEFLERGWSVVATLRNLEARRPQFAEDLARFPQNLILKELDVCNATQRERVSHWIESTYGKLDCLINNAGYGAYGALEDLTEGQMRDEFEVNFFALVLLTRCCLPLLRSARGKIFNVSSVLGYSCIPFYSFYCASKHAVEGFTESLAFELSPFGVQVCLIEPGAYGTAFNKNMVVASPAGANDSPYQNWPTVFLKLRDANRKSKEHDPQILVRKLARFADQRRIPLRYRSGPYAHLIFWVWKLTPSTLRFRLMNRLAWALIHKNI